MLGLAAAPLAATGVSFAQGGPAGGGPVRTTLIAQLFNSVTNAPVGTFAIQRFAAIGGQLVAIGTATITNGTGTLVTTLAQAVTPSINPADPPPGSCPILHLDIGPITINLLGLQITTSEIVLDIVAIPGPGNLLGNLLCDIAGLLNPGGALTNILNQLVGLLNQLLGNL